MANWEGTEQTKKPTPYARTLTRQDRGPLPGRAPYAVARVRREGSASPSRPLSFWPRGFLLVLAMAGCRARGPTPFKQSKPNVSDLVGVWEFDAGTREYLSRRGYRLSTNYVTLRKNGTYAMVNMPDCWGPSDSAKGAFDSATGTWTLGTSSEHGAWAVRLAYARPDGSATERGGGLYVCKENAPHLLYAYVGDPDAGAGLYLERTSSDPNARDDPNAALTSRESVGVRP